MSLIYSFVAREKIILAEFSPYTGNFNTVAIQCLESAPLDRDKAIFTCPGYTLNLLRDEKYSKLRYIVVFVGFLDCRLLTSWSLVIDGNHPSDIRAIQSPNVEKCDYLYI